MGNRLLLLLLIVSFSLTSIKLGAIPTKYVWVFEILQAIGTGIMLALAAYRNPDGTSAKALSQKQQPGYIAPRDLPSED